MLTAPSQRPRSQAEPQAEVRERGPALLTVTGALSHCPLGRRRAGVPSPPARGEHLSTPRPLPGCLQPTHPPTPASQRA